MSESLFDVSPYIFRWRLCDVTGGRLSDVKARPFLKWAGGKRRVISEIASRLPADFVNYWEPFLGGGAVFLALESCRKHDSFLSDTNSDLVDTYIAVKMFAEEVVTVLSEHADRHDPEYYKQIVDWDASDRSIIEKAARFIYLNQTCFNGLYRVNSKAQFNVPIGGYEHPKICDADNLLAAQTMLKTANIGCHDFEMIEPREGDLVYCDPPYDGTFTSYSAKGFTSDDQIRLAEAAESWVAKGALVMLSNSDTTFIRTIYEHAWNIHEITASRTINPNSEVVGPTAELLISSW